MAVGASRQAVLEPIPDGSSSHQLAGGLIGIPDRHLDSIERPLLHRRYPRADFHHVGGGGFSDVSLIVG